MIYRNLLGFLWLTSVSNLFAAEEEVLLLLSDDRIGLQASDGTEPSTEALIKRYYELLAEPTQKKGLPKLCHSLIPTRICCLL